jgi:GNAT superfamily N-acetyltransferase
MIKKLLKAVKYYLTKFKIGRSIQYNLFMEIFPQEKQAEHDFSFVKGVNELSDFIEERGIAHKSRYRVWLEQGYVCIGYIYKGELVGHIWYIVKPIKVPYENTFYYCSIDPSSAILMDIYVLKDYRNLGVGADLWEIAVNVLANSGIRKLEGPILYNNVRSLYLHNKIGLNNIDMIITTYMLGFFYVHVKNKISPPVKLMQLRPEIFMKRHNA